MSRCIDKPLRIAFGLLIGSALSAGAHGGGRVYPIPELTDEMLAEVQLDGFVDEWSHLIGEPAMTLLDFTPELGNAPPGSIDPSDIDFQVWLAWHDEPARLYAAFVAADDSYRNTHTWDVDWEGSIKHEMVANLNDAITLGVDGDHSGGPGFVDQSWLEDDLVEVSGATQLYEAISRTPAGPILDGPRSRLWSGVFSLDDPAPLRGGRGQGSRRIARHLVDRAVHHPVRPQGAGVDQPRGERGERSERRTDHRLRDGGVRWGRGAG